jgi:hypothetical protein
MYWSVSFFGVHLDNAKGHRLTPWGIVALQYPFDVVSAAASKMDVRSPVTGKTVKESSPDEVAKEIARQLGFSETVKYAYSNSPYQDQAFVATANAGYVDFELTETLDTVGCHNGFSTYNFTSMEAAVQNALVYLGRSTPTPWHLQEYLRWALIVLIVGFIIKTL